MENNENVSGNAGDHAGSNATETRFGVGATAGDMPRPGDAIAPRDASQDTERDPLAYRNAKDNGKRRAEYMERLLIDHFFGGSTRRFDEAAGLDFDADK